MKLSSEPTVMGMDRNRKSAIFIPTNTPSEDPRELHPRAIARFKMGIEYARRLRKKNGRANVLVVVTGGWPLYNRLPLSIHHVYAAIKTYKFLKPEELDFVASYGVNTVTDLHGTLKWMNDNLVKAQDAYVVTSEGHAERLVAESDMYSLFEKIYHVESGEPRYTPDEDMIWTERAKDIPPYQYIVGGRASDVSRFGAKDSLVYEQKMEMWAKKNPKLYEKYMINIWRLMQDLEANNVIVRCHTPGCWQLTINC